MAARTRDQWGAGAEGCALTEAVEGERERLQRELLTSGVEAELDFGVVVRLDVDLAEVSTQLVLWVTIPVRLVAIRNVVQIVGVCILGVDLDHHVDLLARKGADVRELDGLVARVGADTAKVIVRD